MEIDLDRINLSRLLDRFFDMEMVARWIDELPAAIWRTIQLALVAEVVGIVIGLFIALGAVHRRRVVRGVFRSYIELWRGTPLLVQILFVHQGLTPLGITLRPFVSGILVLSLNSAAYVAEIFRAGIESVERGQVDAARSLGMSYRQALRLVVLPQAFRRVVPPLTNEFVALTKDSSLLSVIGVVEILQVGRLAFGAEYNSSMYPVVALAYLSLTLPLGMLSRRLEASLAARAGSSWIAVDRERSLAIRMRGAGRERLEVR